MPDSEDTTPQSAAGTKAHRRRPSWPIAAAVLLLLTAAALWGYYALGARDQAPSLETNSSIKSVLHLETFVINLNDPEQRSYLRIGIDLGLTRIPTARDNDGGLPMAQLRDTVLSVLSAGRPEELLTPAGKNKLKADLLTALRRQAPQLGIEEVYFTEFLIQR